MKLNDPLAKTLRQLAAENHLSDVSVMAGCQEFRLDKFSINRTCDGEQMETEWIPLPELVQRSTLPPYYKGVKLHTARWWVKHRTSLLKIRLSRLRWLKAEV